MTILTNIWINFNQNKKAVPSKKMKLGEGIKNRWSKGMKKSEKSS